MTFKEFGQLADAIKTYFPRDNVLPTRESMELWYDMLKDLDYKYAYLGLKMHVASCKFAPTIADIREQATSTVQSQGLNEMEAWAFVSKALRNGLYGAEEEFAKLPELVQKAVGNPSNLRNWAQTDADSVENVIQSNFMRAYRTEAKRQREYEKLPDTVKTLLSVVEKPKQELLSN